MTYFDKMTTEKIILEPEDWTEEEFKTIKKLFGVEKLGIENPKVESIVIPRGITYYIVLKN